jgi:hypothetical protein
MSTLSTTVRRGLVVTAAAAVAGPFATAAASAATSGPTTAAPVDTTPIANVIEPSADSTVSNGVSQFADTIPVGRTAPVPNLSALPLAGPLAGQLPMAGPMSSVAMPVLSGVTGGLPLVGPLVGGLPVVGPMLSPASAVAAPATRSAMPERITLPAQIPTKPAVQPASKTVSKTAAKTVTQPAAKPVAQAPAPAAQALPSLSSLSGPAASLPNALNSPLGGDLPGLPTLPAASSLPMVGALPLQNLPVVGSVTGLLHF